MSEWVELILKKEMIRLHKKRLMGKQKRDGIGSGMVGLSDNIIT
jgi:hypothetical protein